MDKDYYSRQKSNSNYYNVVGAYIAENKDLEKWASVIDVGCGPTEEILRWKIPAMTMLDQNPPPALPGVRSITADITQYDFKGETWDLVVCMQTLEHIPHVALAISALFSIATKTVIVSLPYQWTKGTERDHVHDPIDMAKIDRWFHPHHLRWTMEQTIFCDNQQRIVLIFKKVSTV